MTDGMGEVQESHERATRATSRPGQRREGTASKAKEIKSTWARSNFELLCLWLDPNFEECVLKDGYWLLEHLKADSDCSASCIRVSSNHKQTSSCFPPIFDVVQIETERFSAT